MSTCQKCGGNVLRHAPTCLQCGHAAPDWRPDRAGFWSASLSTARKRDAAVLSLHRQGVKQAAIGVLLERAGYRRLTQAYVSRILTRHGVWAHQPRTARDTVILQLAVQNLTQQVIATRLTAAGTPITQSGVSVVLRKHGAPRQMQSPGRDDLIRSLATQGLTQQCIADRVAEAGYIPIIQAAVSDVLVKCGRRRYVHRRPAG